MPEILVLWEDTLKSIFYEAHETVEQFRDRFFYSFENHLEHPEVFTPHGHLKWKEKLMLPDLLMVNYPFEEEDIIIYHSEAFHRVNVLMDVKGSPTLLIFHFDEATTVQDLKRMLVEKLTDKRVNLSLKRIMLSYESMVMEEETLTLIDFGVKPSSLLRAKEIPEARRASLQSDLYELKFNGKCKNVLENRFPVENMHITVGVHDSEYKESFVDFLSIACYEVNSTEIMDPLDIIVIGNEVLNSGSKVTFLLDNNLKFNAKYRLEIESMSSKYGPNDNIVTIEFKTRPRYGNIHFSGDKSIFNFTFSPLPTNMPIVHSLLHLLRKNLFLLGNEDPNYVDEILREVIGFQVIYETGFAANFFSLCANNGQHERSKPEVYLIDGDGLQEDLQLEYYENGFDIFVKVLTRSATTDSSRQLIAGTVENVHNNDQTVEVEDAHTEPISFSANKVIFDVKETAYVTNDRCSGDDSANVITGKVEVEEANDEDEEVRSVHAGNDQMTDLSFNRQGSDGSSLVSALEFVEDGYLVLMPVDALDHSILEVDDVEKADIIVEH